MASKFDISPLQRLQQQAYQTEVAKGRATTQTIAGVANMVSGNIEKERQRRKSESDAMLNRISETGLQAADYEYLQTRYQDILNKHAKMMSEQKGLGAVLFGKDISPEQEQELNYDMRLLMQDVQTQKQISELADQAIKNKDKIGANVDTNAILQAKKMSTIPQIDTYTGNPFLKYDTSQTAAKGLVNEIVGDLWKTDAVNKNTVTGEFKQDPTGFSTADVYDEYSIDDKSVLGAFQMRYANDPRARAIFDTWKLGVDTLPPMGQEAVLKDWAAQSKYKAPLQESFLRTYVDPDSLYKKEEQKPLVRTTPRATGKKDLDILNFDGVSLDFGDRAPRITGTRTVYNEQGELVDEKLSNARAYKIEKGIIPNTNKEGLYVRYQQKVPGLSGVINDYYEPLETSYDVLSQGLEKQQKSYVRGLEDMDLTLTEVDVPVKEEEPEPPKKKGLFTRAKEAITSATEKAEKQTLKGSKQQLEEAAKQKGYSLNEYIRQLENSGYDIEIVK
jgi:hypothetical protein